MKDKLKPTEEERKLADERIAKIFEQVKSGEITEEEAIEKLSPSNLYIEWEKRYYEQCDIEYDEYIEKNKGKEILLYNPETFWPVFDEEEEAEKIRQKHYS